MSLMNNSSREETGIEIRTSLIKEDRPILDPSEKLQYEVKEFHRKLWLGYYDAVFELPYGLIFWFDYDTFNTALHIAAKAGRINQIKKLLSTYADFKNPEIVNAWSGYRGVVSRDNPYSLDIVNAWLGYRGEVSRLNPYSLDDLIEFVLLKNKEGNTMLHEAMMCNKKHIGDMVWEALEAYDHLGRGSNGKTLAESCYTDASIVTNHEKKTVLYLAVEAGYQEAVKKMLDKGTIPNQIIGKPMGLSPIVLAIMNRDEATLSMILEKRPDWVYLIDQEERLPLHYAASIGHYEGVILLLEKGEHTDQFHRDQYGYLPIHLASHGGHCKVVKHLLMKSPSSNNLTEMLDNFQRNILHIAANNGQHEVVRYILQTDELQDMINEKDDNGNTPLHLAVRSCHPKTVHFLTWDSRVSLNLVNKKYQTPLDIVTEIYQLQGNSFMTEANALYQVEEGTSSIRQMDFVDEPRELLRTMEVNQIGTKRCQFYQAYALYYEKSKKYHEAEKMYHLGVKNLAEPVDELQKSYEQFLQRMKRKNKKSLQQEVRASRRPLSTNYSTLPFDNKTEGSNGACSVEGVHMRPQIASSVSKDVADDRHVKKKNSERKRFRGDDTVVLNKFVDTAMDGKSRVEDACHHGLVDPTINMKEAMNAINSMFREPLENVPLARKSHKNHSKENRGTTNDFQVFVDENLDNGIKPSSSLSLQHGTEARKPHQEPFQIYIDDEGCSETSNVKVNLSEDSTSPPSKQNDFVFLRPKDLPSGKSSDMNAESSRNLKFREDTVVRRFVGSTILDEPKVENVCHHGLVDPTINMKEAMDDINNMFGKPMDFVRKKRSVKQEKAPENNSKKELGGFSILADDDMEQQEPLPPKLPGKSKGSGILKSKGSGILKSKESDLFEPTLLTKEAMDDINKMFNMPLNF